MNNCIVKTFLSFALLFSVASSFAQVDSSAVETVESKSILNKIDLSNRPNDHFMLQYGMDSWGSVPDSINTSGFSRHFNVYVMLDKPLKSSQHMSIGIGLGIGSSNIFFDDTYVNIKSSSTQLPFTNVGASAVNHFSKFKLTTIFAELPVELRYAGNPVSPDKGFKTAFGLKVGTLLNEHIKGKNAIDATGNSIYGTKYIAKKV